MAVMIPYSGNLTSFVLCRMVARMNLTHTVGDIRNFINAYAIYSTPLTSMLTASVYSSRPENRVRDYTIGTTFPNRTLDDDSVTIQDAKLANSVIVQRWA